MVVLPRHQAAFYPALQILLPDADPTSDTVIQVRNFGAFLLMM
jgi:phage tail protein X